MSNLSKRRRIWRRLKRSAAARRQFVDSHISKAIAFQVREMRARAKLSQAELGERCGTGQNAIHRLESPGYGRYSVSTLKKVAAAFDVGLVVRFAPFSELADWAAGLSRADILVPCFESEDREESKAPESTHAEGFALRMDTGNSYRGSDAVAPDDEVQQGPVSQRESYWTVTTQASEPGNGLTT